jgi:hypothetical protein
MTPDNLDRVIDITHQEVMRFFKPDCCVLATRILRDVLARLGVKSVPVSVCAAFYDQTMADHVHAHGCHFWQCREKLDLDARTVICGIPASQRKNSALDSNPIDPFQGHVVLVAQCDDYELVMVDLTVEQASHPEIGFPISKPLVVPVDTSWFMGRGDFEGQTEAGFYVRYFAMPADRWFAENSPDWEDTTILHTELINAVLARLHDQQPQYSRETLTMLAVAGRV